MIEFIPECHTYLADGIIIPSVSKLVSYATGDDYSNIPSYILKQAQDFGTDIHIAIETYIKHGTITEFEEPYKKLAFDEFLRIYQEVIRNPKLCICEVMVDYEERYAGRFDCLTEGILIDYKTNTNINIPHLEYQMGLYKMAMESKGLEINKCMCLWLPKRKSGKWVEITPKSKEECLKVLEEYENNSKFEGSPY